MEVQRWRPSGTTAHQGNVLESDDFVQRLSPEIELSLRNWYEIILYSDVEVGFDFQGVRDGDVLPLGNDRITIWHTPGHTPEHVSLLVADETRADEPWLAFTGHTLMVGDLGRTELASSAEAGARALFQSARRLMSLPDYVEIYPGAYSGPVCGRSLSGKPASTIGFERRHNRALAFDDEAGFVAYMAKEVPPRPENAEANRAANAGLPVMG